MGNEHETRRHEEEGEKQLRRGRMEMRGLGGGSEAESNKAGAKKRGKVLQVMRKTF